MVGIEVTVAGGGSLPLSVTATSVDQLLFTGGGVLRGWSLRDGTGNTLQSASGSVTSPAAGATVAQIAGLPAGTYRVRWNVGLSGTLGAPETNNFNLFKTGGTVLVSDNPSAVGVFSQIDTEVTITAGQTIGIHTGALATVGAVYTADLAISTVGETETIVELQDGNTILGEIDFTTFRSHTEWFDADGPQIQTQLNLHVVTGIVLGTVYVNPTYT